MKENKSKTKGFTLLDLMLTVAIVGVFTAIAIPAYKDYSIRAQVAEGFSLASGIKPLLIEFESNHGRFPLNNEEARFAGAVGNYVQRMDIYPNGVVAATFGSNANKEIRNKKVYLLPIYSYEDPNSGIITPEVNANNFVMKTFIAIINPLLKPFVSEAIAQTVSPEENTGWICISSIDEKYLPTSCKHQKNIILDEGDDDNGETTPTPVTIVNQYIDTRNQSCQPGYTGSITESQEVIEYSDGTVTRGDWIETNNSCTAIPVTIVNQYTNTRSQSCQPGYTGSITESQNVIEYSNGTVTRSGWTQTGNSCTAIPPTITTETSSRSCTAPQTGSITTTRTVTTTWNGIVSYGPTTETSNCSYPATIPHSGIVACTPNQPVGACVQLNARPGYNAVILSNTNIMMCQAPYNRVVGSAPNVSCGM